MRNTRLHNVLKTIKLNESTISTILGAIVVLVVGYSVVNYFRGLRVSETQRGSTSSTATQQEEAATFPKEYTVSAGEHLWGISEKYYGSGYNWVDIQKANNLANPNHIEVGQKLSLPKVEVPMAQATEATVASATAENPGAIANDSYTVVKGDHLWGIAIRAYGDGYQWVKIAEVNSLANPDLIYPDTTLKLPR